MSAAKKLPPQSKYNFQPFNGYEWSYRVLVVDDEREIAASYKDILCPEPGKVVPLRSSRSQKAESPKTGASGFQFQITQAHSYEEALGEVKSALKRGEPFAMGFFDVKLGGGEDGYDLVKAIQEIDPEMYAVFVTAYNDRSIDSIHDYLGKDRADRWDYLNKPFNDSEILQKARNLVSLWNLQNEKWLRDTQLAELHRRVRESERSTSVSAMARGVGHEFGNLLMQITGQAEVNAKKGEEEMRAALGKILDACGRAGDILDRFNEASSPGAGHPPKEKFFVNEIIEEALGLMNHQFKSSGIKTCFIKKEAVLAEVSSTALLQVIVNLSINAMHAMPGGGQIDYSVVKIAEAFEIRVRDYGPGIDEKIIGKVTETFFTTKGDGGTGLGLAICKEIVEIEHYGHFEVKNHGSKKGLEIVMRMPLVEGGDI